MDGCLTTLIKLFILGLLFVSGLVMGYLYYQGVFDPYLVEYTLRRLDPVAPEEAEKRVDARATVEDACRNFSLVDRRYVVWPGTLTDSRALTTELTTLTIRSASESRRLFVAYYSGSFENLGIRLGDQIEVLGQARKVWVPAEDREGRPYPQVIAIRVRKGSLTPGAAPVPAGSPAPPRPAAGEDKGSRQ
ncbi:MAG: hypothetical protein HY815_20300 [Candidatus Riflebacteria bacterium]|nr:hypothetical protein [Candidatus Riflebacteria bacterium]